MFILDNCDELINNNSEHFKEFMKNLIDRTLQLKFIIVT